VSAPQNLSRCEWELMLLCWKLGRPTAREVHEASLAKKRRDYRTVLATLNNIAAKGFLRVEKNRGPRNVPTNRYLPAVSRQEAMEQRIRTFLEEDLEWAPDALELLAAQLLERTQ
jgi:predicted transcriptional regulator